MSCGPIENCTAGNKDTAGWQGAADMVAERVWARGGTGQDSGGDGSRWAGQRWIRMRHCVCRACAGPWACPWRTGRWKTRATGRTTSKSTSKQWYSPVRADARLAPQHPGHTPATQEKHTVMAVFLLTSVAAPSHTYFHGIRSDITSQGYTNI